jgi:hypothetical protein
VKLPNRTPRTPTPHEIAIGQIRASARASWRRELRAQVMERERKAWSRIEAEDRAEEMERMWLGKPTPPSPCPRPLIPPNSDEVAASRER